MRLTRIGTNKDLSKPSSEEISAQVERFLRTGGHIKFVPMGMSGDDKTQHFKEVAQRREERMKAVRERRDQGENISTKMAAKLIGKSERWVRAQINRGEGPPLIREGQKYRFLRNEVLEWWRNRETQN